MPFSDFEIELLQRATCLITLNDQTRQTGFLASREGYVLTAGHGLSGCNLNVGDSVTAEFEGFEPIQGQICEIVYSLPLDFALIRVENSEISLPAPIAISETISNISGQEFTLIGFRAANTTTKYALPVKTRVLGRIVGKSKMSNGRPFQLQLGTDQRELYGMSGGGIFTRIGGQVVAIGIQSLQDKNNQKDAFACPFIYLKDHSAIIKELLRRIRPAILDLDRRFLQDHSKRKTSASVSRRILFVDRITHPKTSHSVKFRDRFYDRWDRFSNADGRYIDFPEFLRRRLKNLSWIREDAIRLNLEKNWVQVFSENQKTGFDRLLAADKTSDNEFAEYRIIFDLDSVIPEDDRLKEESLISHLIGVTDGTDEFIEKYSSQLFQLKIPDYVERSA